MFYVTSIIGSGATCIVYEAYYLDDLDLRHNVRIKECCPIGDCEELRGNNQEIQWKSAQNKERAFVAFEKVYRRHLGLQTQYDFINITSKIIDYLYEGYNTKYLVMECDNGKSLEKSSFISLYDRLKTLRALSNTIGRFHDIGWLHLDLKPENFMVIPETTELVKLFDFDSLVSIDALQEGRIKSVSFSSCWAAPEVRRGELVKICCASDIYSLGALLYYMVFDEKPDLKSRLDYGKYCYDDLKIIKNVNPLVKTKLTDFLKNTMSPKIEKRYQSIKQVVEKLDELIRLADPAAMFLCSTVPVQTNYFSGRQQELEMAHNILAMENVLVVTGIGGVGKTEFCQCFARKYAADYSCIVWAKVETTVEELLLEDNIFNIYGYDSNSHSVYEKIKVLNGLVSSDTLIILDNVRDYEEVILSDLLSLPCKFLITSRTVPENIIPHTNYINLNCMRDEELLDVFCHYYRKPLYDSDIKQVINLLHEIGNYTLLVPIIAKQMRLSAITPKQMLEKIKDTALGAEFPEKVKHKKDMVVYEGAMLEHVANIFSWTDFTTEELLALKVLASLGRIKISRASLAAWCGFSTYGKYKIWNIFEELYKELDLSAINGLIEKGILIYREELERLEMHDVISSVIRKKFDRNINTFDAFADNLSNICSGIKEWKEEYENDFFCTYDEVSEYQIQMYLSMIFEFFENLDLSIKDNVAYLIANLQKICVLDPFPSLKIIEQIEHSRIYSNEDELVINMMKVNCYWEKYHYFIRGGEEERDKYEREKVENSYNSIIHALNFAKKYYKNNKEKYLEYCLEICEPLQYLVEQYTGTFYDTTGYNKVYNKVLSVIRKIKKESSNQKLLKKAEELRDCIVKGNKEHLKYLKEKKYTYSEKVQQNKDILDEYQEEFEKSKDTLEVLEKCLKDTELSISGKRWLIEENAFPQNWMFLHHPSQINEKIENPKKYISNKEFYFQRLFLKLYVNGYLEEEMRLRSMESVYKDVIIECALRKEYKALLLYMHKLESILRSNYSELYFMFISFTLQSMMEISEILERLELKMLANYWYSILAELFLNNELNCNIKNTSDSIYPYFLNSAMECAKECSDLESYIKYQDLMRELLHVDFSYDEEVKKLKNNVLSKWRYYIKKIVSEESFENIQSLREEILKDNILECVEKAFLVSEVLKPYSWTEILCHSSIAAKGYGADINSLYDLLVKYKEKDYSSLVEKITIVAGICFVSSVLNEEEISMSYIKTYKCLFEEIKDSEVEMLALLRYESLAALWMQNGEVDRANELYVHMYNGLMSNHWRKYSYYDSKLTKEIYNNMFGSLLAQKNNRNINLYRKSQEQYLKYCEKLKEEWNEDELMHYC